MRVPASAFSRKAAIPAQVSLRRKVRNSGSLPREQWIRKTHERADALPQHRLEGGADVLWAPN
jgi:hypothetical protein